MDRAHGSTAILEMAFISPNLAIDDIQFQIGVDLGSNRLLIQISIDTTTDRDTSTNLTKYKFEQTDREVFESTLNDLNDALSGLLFTSDLDKYDGFIATAISTAVDKAISKSKSVRPESNPTSDETLAQIKEKRRLRIQYSQKKDPAIKTCIIQLQKQEHKVESLVSWEKFCNSNSLETNTDEVLAQNKELPQVKGSARLSNFAPLKQIRQDQR